ncbi:oligosaccharide repeat unit polymerase [Vibrio parahaemolyticus]|nr:oligosaccharide repeat unit polymerase [Vibrio parahaemolyticus]
MPNLLRNFIFKVNNIFLVQVFCFILPYIYIYSVYPMYEYMGFTYTRDLNIYSGITISFFAFIGSMLLPKHIDKPTSLLFTVTFFLIYCPSVSMMYIVTNLEYEVILSNCLVLWACLLIIFTFSNINIPNISYKRLGITAFKTIFFSTLFISLLSIFIFYNFSFSNLMMVFDFSQTYDIREGFRDISVPQIVKYMFFAASKALVPLLFLYALKEKNKTLALLAFLIQVCIFAVSGHKSVFLGVILVYLSWQYLSRNGCIRVYSISLGLVVFCSISSILDWMFGYNFLVNIFTRRMILVPGMLSGMYYEFYFNNEYARLAYSLLSSVFPYNYSSTPPFVIGNYYFDSDFMSANVNYVASGFAEFGYLGMIVFVSLASVLYKSLDMAASNNKESSFVICALLLPTWVLVDSSLLTAMITHGLLLISIIVLFYPKFRERQSVN